MPGDDRAGRDAPNEQFLGGCRLLSYAFTEKQEVLHQMVRELNQPHQPKEPIVNQPPRAPHDVLRAAPEGLRNALQYPFFQAASTARAVASGSG